MAAGDPPPHGRAIRAAEPHPVRGARLVDESELLRRACAGDAGAFDGIVERHAEPLWRCARALCHDDHEAEDLAQETLLEAWRALPRFDGRCRFSTWLYGILRHRYLKSRRKPRPSVGADEVARERAARGIGPSASATMAEEARLVREALATLSDDHRTVLELRFFAGASLDEIATLVGCPLGTVKSRLHHGLEKLRLGTTGANLSPRPGESPTSDT